MKQIDTKNEKKTISEALISTRDKEVKKQPVRKARNTGKDGRRPRERKCTSCNAPNWSPIHKCPARMSTCHTCRKGVLAKVFRFENQKQQEIERCTEPEETEGASVYKLMNRITEKSP